MRQRLKGAVSELPQIRSLLDLAGLDLSEERFEELLSGAGFRMERIVSDGQASPPGFWYQQSHHEWVILISGSARLRFADPDGLVSLEPGDCLDIPAGRRHRVEATDANGATVWLALHYQP